MKMEQDLKKERIRHKWDALGLGVLKGTDAYGNQYVFQTESEESKEISVFLCPKDGRVRNLGKIIHTPKGFVYSKHEDEEIGIMNNTFSWSVPVKILKTVDYVQYVGKYATYAIAAKKALATGREADWGGKGFDKQFYIPIEAFKVFFRDKKLEALVPHLGLDWTIYLAKYILKGDLFRILGTLKTQEEKGKMIFPKKKDIFKAFKMCPLRNVKCVIIGQDPYHSPKGQATGLAFGCGIFTSPSLKNILKELDSDIPKNSSNLFQSEYFDTSLESWAKQGVLLLNSSLTVLASSPGSHAKLGWDHAIIIPALKELIARKKTLSFIIWGAHAAKIIDALPKKGEFGYFKSAHPSPLSAEKGFFGSRPFSRVNQYLISNKQKPIEWR